MTRARGPFIGALVALAGAALAQASLDPLHAVRTRVATTSQPLFMPSPLAAKLMALGHRSTLADLIYLWSIQRFSERPTDTEAHVAHLWRTYDTITELDPKFRDAYWLGYVSLLLEGESSDHAFRLADKALDNDPGFTFMAIEAGLAARQLGREDLMVHYLERGAELGDVNARRFLTRLRTMETAQQEMVAWVELLDLEDELTRSIAASHVRDLTVLIDTHSLEKIAACYARERGRSARSVQQLVDAGYLAVVPVDPEGEPYELDPDTQRARSRTPYRHSPPSRARGIDLSHLGRCGAP